MQLKEGLLTFDFPPTFNVAKYDDWSFYRNQYVKVCGGSKAVDFVAVDNSVLWLIEVKDYRSHARTKVIDLADEFAIKVRDSLAGLVAAAAYANDSQEQIFARKAIRKQRIRIILHLEQPLKHSKLFPRLDTSNIRIKARQLTKAIDAHSCVVEKANLRGLPWVVS